MEFRNSEKVKIVDQIKKYERYINENEENIQKTDKKSNTRTHINNLSIKNSELKSKISSLENRLLRLNTGELDLELLQKNGIKNTSNKNTSNKNTSNKNTSQDYENAFSYYRYVNDNIPDYMIKKIKNTPNNKGYIWKGVWFFGELPEEKGKPIVFFDKQRDGTLAIHEFSDRNYKIWHKKENQHKTLYMNKIRRLK
jgi:hypothetical protein